MTTIRENFKEYTKDDEDNEIKIIDDLNKTFEEVTFDCYGTDWYELDKEQLNALNEGKVLILTENGGEYQMFLKKK